MRLKQVIFIMPFLAVLSFIPAALIAQDRQSDAESGEKLMVYNGFFSREENDGKMARMSGKSHYMKFYPPNRVIRLFIPYPYSTTVKAEAISRVFAQVSKKSIGDAFIRGKFGVMDQDVIANIGTVKIGGDVILFDCDSSSPCKVIFMDNALQVVKKGILADHIIEYEHIDI